MPLVVSQLTVDAVDPDAQALWWQGVLGGTVEHDEDDPDEVELVVEEGRPGLLFLRVPEPKPGGVKNRLHLDIRPPDGSDQATELERLLAHGARRADIGQGDVPWEVLADPEGNEFCLLRSTPADLAAARAAKAAPG